MAFSPQASKGFERALGGERERERERARESGRDREGGRGRGHYHDAVPGSFVAFRGAPPQLFAVVLSVVLGEESGGSTKILLLDQGVAILEGLCTRGGLGGSGGWGWGC